MSLLSGLSSLGLGNLENVDIFAKEEKEAPKKEAPKVEVQAALEKDMILDKTMKCPVCDKTFTTKMVKTGKAKLIGTDFDLRPRHEGIDTNKYDVALCTNCGYAALTRFFDKIGTAQAKLVRENISQNVKLGEYFGDTYPYEQCLERYKLALVNSVVKRAKSSEKAYVCLKTAWICRGFAEELEATDNDKAEEMIKELKEEEEKQLSNALNGFTEARSTESFPMCGMDEMTMDYLLAQLNHHFGNYDDAARLVSGILTNRNAKPVIKNKALDLKEQIVADKKKAQG